MANKNSNKPESLSDRVERVSDTLDANPEDFFKPYIEKLFSELRAPEISFASPESSRASLENIDAVLARIEQGRRRIQQLRNMVESEEQ